MNSWSCQNLTVNPTLCRVYFMAQKVRLQKIPFFERWLCQRPRSG
ncbi:hypothetical protein HMPREF9996_00812 [Aggregatibacter actinomycetemcomitans Y4]|nr:hypothetical protein HMPREF9996_00812 [Aggregatibacter actinomycetemcomitans Y4]